MTSHLVVSRDCPDLHAQNISVAGWLFGHAAGLSIEYKHGNVRRCSRQQSSGTADSRLASPWLSSRVSSQAQSLAMRVFPVVLLGLFSVSIAVPTHTSANTAVHQLSKRAAQCFPFERLETVGINPADCVAALGTIPITDTMFGDFGNKVAAGSHYKLPRHFAQGNCMIGVTMMPAGLSQMDKSSWPEIYLRASGILSKCVLVPEPARRGGSDLAGQSKQISVQLFMYSPHLAFMVPLNDYRLPIEQQQRQATA